MEYYVLDEWVKRVKKGDLIVIEAGKRHRASSSGSVLLSIEPHERGR